ncbi:hypothetical protein M1141_02755 [Candidatus Marsarchaeota archaeon]|nr:hypothetical protein [Candidatus Marsarchaeota archaeon]
MEKKIKNKINVEESSRRNLLPRRFLRHSIDSVKKTPEESSKAALIKKLERTDKIFNFIESFTTLSPIIGIATIAALHKIGELNGVVVVEGYIGNLIGIFSLPFSIYNIKKSREKFKERILKKYNRKK